MSDLEERKQLLKDLIRRLHAGAESNELKDEFAQILKEIGPSEISEIEEELIKDGMEKEKIRSLCDIHLAIFKDTIESQKIEVEPGHPVHILLKEHEFVKKVVGEISSILPEAGDTEGFDKTALKRIGQLLAHLREYEKHKVREENTLFPYLEKHAMTGPPSIMWAEHDEQRKKIKLTEKTLASEASTSHQEFTRNLVSHLHDLTTLIPNHFYKEENILFPTALKLFSDEEWKEIKASMDDLGYCDFTPAEAIGGIVETAKPAEKMGDRIVFETGSLSGKELEAMLNSMPVDITFVDANDEVRYFSQTKDRIFPRTKTIIGRKVQHCHPQKSVHVVNQILDDFRNGRKDAAEFWLQMGEMTIYIRYFAVRDESEDYLGCLEVTQDIAPIKRIEGEKRLL